MQIVNNTNNKLFTTAGRQLLNNKDFDIEFNGYLSNHAKHAIIALDRLGAHEQRIVDYWKMYTHLTPYNLPLHKVEHAWEKVQPASAEQWRQWRGKKVGWQEQVEFLRDELEGRFEGRLDELVQHYAPELIVSGVAGALTHGIIHTGWGIDADSQFMTLEGLAYLNFSHLGIDEAKLQMPSTQKENNNGDQASEEMYPMETVMRIAQTFQDENLQEKWIKRVKQDYGEDFHPELVPAGFQWHLAKVLHEPHEVATKLPMWLGTMEMEELWRKLYKCVVTIYLATRSKMDVEQQGAAPNLRSDVDDDMREEQHGSFLVLHLLTSLWSLEKVCRMIGKEDVSRRAIGQFFASAICLLSASSDGFVRPETLGEAQNAFPLRSVASVDDGTTEDQVWNKVVQDAIAEEEEHNIKLVYVMRELWKRYDQWDGFLEAARSFTLTPNIGPSSTSFSGQ